MDDFFRAAPSSVAAIRLNHSASPVQEVSPMFVVLAHVALLSCQTEGSYWAGERGILTTAQVQCGKNGGFDVFSVWLYLLYILLLRYIVIYLEL